MKCYAKDVIKTAKAEVGYLEKKSNKDLDSKTKNAGYNNYTKYAEYFDKECIDFYNGKKQGYAWCDVFVDWCFVTTYGEGNALRLLCQPKHSCGAGTSFSAGYFKNKGQFAASPKIGDQIFFMDAEGDICHTGIVIDVDKKNVYTIEGNTSSDSGVVANGGAVAEKKYSLTYKRIAGYGRPDYDDVVTYQGTFPKLPARGYFKSGDKGTQVTYLQQFLNWYAGKKLAVDGIIGVKTIEQVKNFQKKEKLEVDGLFGKKSLAKAKTVKK